MSEERLSGELLEAVGGDQWQDVEMEENPESDDPEGEDLEEGVGFSSPLWGGATVLMRAKDAIDKFRATIEQMARPGRVGGLEDLDSATRQEVETVDKEAKSLERQLVALHNTMLRVAARAKKLDRAVGA